MSMFHEISGGMAHKRGMRKGRGESSKGKTAGRGTKAAHGGDVAWKPGHEGGQTPLHRRLPKRGFSNDPFAVHYYIVNVGALNSFKADATVDAASLEADGFIPDNKLPIKILGDGELKVKLNVVADWYSKSALEQIKKIGGQAKTPAGADFEHPKEKKKFVLRVAAKPAKAAPTDEKKEEAK